MAAVFAAFLATTTAHAAPAPAAPLNTVTLPVQDAPAQLPVRSEDRTGYERTKFKHWVDADKDGCNTCAEVLEAEAVVAPEQGASCRLSGGAWFSPYDDRFIQGPGGVDIGHLVLLAEAWDSGALDWSAKEREAYANDLGDERALIAMSAASKPVQGRPGSVHVAAAGCRLLVPVRHRLGGHQDALGPER
ncbi:HNH endonuclease [Streptomyces olivaceoviridis]|uniref:HNH endonuclease n=1 Tax=Streptomyces olivaceoviridis TaxID=1921 RepID=UPI003407474D